MSTQLLAPDFIFETSWEVCNRVGGIYTVLSTRAKTLQTYRKDKLLFVGPDIWKDKTNPFFKENKALFTDWKKELQRTNSLNIRTGRWNIPGAPLVVLVDFSSFYKNKDEIYTQFWNLYQVDSLHAYGDYDEACMFAYASAKVMESFYLFYLKNESKNVIAHFNEWTTGLGALYLKSYRPEIATVFTTHATSIGRSIAGNGKPLYDYLSGYNGDQMAHELNMESKHSLEKNTAIQVDCFTTVSDITAKECDQLLRPVDIVTPNGFEDGFLPKKTLFEKKRKNARHALINVAESLLGYPLKKDIFIIGTGGRNEFKNKGLDVFLSSMAKLNKDSSCAKEILAYILVPSDVYGARMDLNDRLNEKKEEGALYDSFLSHWLNRPENDSIYRTIHYHNLLNSPNDKVKIVYVPCYLNGDDGIFNKSYYDLLIGMDLTIFPSYYEPWGYTPLESIAFSIPTITTDLSGFGLWANKVSPSYDSRLNGFAAVHRTDLNYNEVIDQITELIHRFLQRGNDEIATIREASRQLAIKALWSKFIHYYYQAYHIALTNRNKRINLD